MRDAVDDGPDKFRCTPLLPVPGINPGSWRFAVRSSSAKLNLGRDVVASFSEKSLARDRCDGKRILYALSRVLCTGHFDRAGGKNSVRFWRTFQEAD